MPEPREVTLYRKRIDQIPIVGSFISREDVMRNTADGMSLTRAVAGPIYAAYTAFTKPQNRSWWPAIGYGFLAGTDKLDGDIARANMAAMTPEERAFHASSGREKRSKKLDHLGDKWFVGPVIVALVLKRDISFWHLAKFGRDGWVGEIKEELATLSENGYQSASRGGQWKATTEMTAAGTSVSPVAERRVPVASLSISEAAFTMATLLSLKTGIDYARDLMEARAANGDEELPIAIDDYPVFDLETFDDDLGEGIGDVYG